MRIINGMKAYTFEELLDRDLGPIGTPERDAFEAEVKAAVEAEKQAAQPRPRRQGRAAAIREGSLALAR